MKKSERKEVTSISFKGVAVDGGFVFYACFMPAEERKMETITFKITSYVKGVMEIAIDCEQRMPLVAKLMARMFAKESNFANLDFVIFNYRNIRLRIGKNVGRKTITRMMLKAMSKPEYKVQDNDITVDTCICQKCVPLRSSDTILMPYLMKSNSFQFDEVYRCGKYLWFINCASRESIIISSIKDGVVTVESVAGEIISDFVAELRKPFVPYSNFYGIKALEVSINDFSIRIDAQNSDRILELYRRSSSMSTLLEKKEFQEAI